MATRSRIKVPQSPVVRHPRRQVGVINVDAIRSRRSSKSANQTIARPRPGVSMGTPRPRTPPKPRSGPPPTKPVVVVPPVLSPDRALSPTRTISNPGGQSRPVKPRGYSVPSPRYRA
jgi:hypothetical protein